MYFISKTARAEKFVLGVVTALTVLLAYFMPTIVPIANEFGGIELVGSITIDGWQLINSLTIELLLVYLTIALALNCVYVLSLDSEENSVILVTFVILLGIVVWSGFAYSIVDLLVSAFIQSIILSIIAGGVVFYKFLSERFTSVSLLVILVELVVLFSVIQL